MTVATYTQSERRVFRIHQVLGLTGFSRAWVYELMKRGDFPKARKIGKRAVGWDSLEVEAFVSRQLDGAGR